MKSDPLVFQVGCLMLQTPEKRPYTPNGAMRTDDHNDDDDDDNDDDDDDTNLPEGN